MNRSSLSDPDRSMPVFFTGCVSPEVKYSVKSQSPEKTPTLTLSPKDFDNIRQSVDTLLSKKRNSDHFTALNTSPNLRRSLLPLPSGHIMTKLNGEESSTPEPFQHIQQNFVKDLSVNQNFGMKRPRNQFPDQAAGDSPSEVSPKRRCLESSASSSFASDSSFSPSTSATHTPKFHKDNVGCSPRVGEELQEPQAENVSGGRKRKALLPYPEELLKIARPNFPPSDVWEQLSRDIWALYHKNKQSPEVLQKKMILRQQLHDILRLTFPTCGLYVVGSSMTGLGGNRSDMDMCLMVSHEEVDQKREAINYLREAFSTLIDYEFIRCVQLIPAKVPILKFKDTVSQIEVDLNVNNSVGIRNTQLLNSYSRIDERVPPLVILVKMWAQQHKINNAKHNTLSSYSLVLMVIHYLQYGCSPPVVPCLQEVQHNKYHPESDVRTLSVCEELPDFVSENYESVGQLFLGFLNYFANVFDFTKNAISVRVGGIVSKNDAMNVPAPKNKTAHWKYIGIEEPFELTNTACSVFKDNAFYYIQNAFQRCWNMLNKNKRLRDVLHFKL